MVRAVILLLRSMRPGLRDLGVAQIRPSVVVLVAPVVLGVGVVMAAEVMMEEGLWTY